MRPYVGSLEMDTLQNMDFRRVLFTGKNEQLVVMALAPGEEIGRETHESGEQFFRVEEGIARFEFGPGEDQLARAGEAVVVPAGTPHNVVNASATKSLRLFTIYSPPQHPEGAIHHTKAAAMAVAHP